MTRRVVLQWPRLGPLHLNRLRAAHEVLGAAGYEVVALEVASDDALYDWREDRRPTPFPRVTLFPGQRHDDMAPRAMYAAVTAALDRLDPTAVHIHAYSMPDAWACLAWCRRHRRRAVCMAESKATDAARHSWREALKRTLVSQFDAAQASGSAGARYIADLGVPPERVFLGYSVVDNDYFAQEASRYRADPAAGRHLPGLDDPTPFFFASNRFVARKNLPALLRSYGAYRRHAPDPWRLVLLGDGPLRPDLERLLAAEGIDGVTLAGWQQIEALPAYYARAGAFVHAAEVDQWGLVVNEAMASGLPVIVSTGAGCAGDLVAEGENGFTFDPPDEERLARHLHRVAHEVDRAAFGRRSLEIIAQWPLRRFGTSLLQAVEAADGPHRRGLDPRARLLIALMLGAFRSPRSFHTVHS